MPILNMDHVSIRVKDLERMYQFYHKVLELPVVRKIGPEDNLRIVFLQGLEFSRIRPEDEDRGGFNHLGIEVINIDEVYEELKKKGIIFDMPVRDIKFEKERKAVKIVFFRDPEGNRIELVEWRDL